MSERQYSKTHSNIPVNSPLNIIVCGVKGAGKSTLIHRLGLSDIESGSISEFSDPQTAAQLEQFLTADLLILTVTAQVGFDEVARRSICVGLLMGVEKIILCVTKMDHIGFDQEQFSEIAREFKIYCEKLIDQASLTDPKPEFYAIPFSAVAGENMGEYDGISLWKTISSGWKIQPDLNKKSLRFRVMEDSSTLENIRQIRGKIISGTAKSGMQIVVMPSAVTGIISKVASGSDTLDIAYPGDQVSLNTENSLTASKGDLVCDARDRVQVADQFDALIINSGRKSVLPARAYEFRLDGSTAIANISDLKYKFDIVSLEKLATNELQNGDISICNISIDRKIPFESHRLNASGGLFSLVDQSTGEVLASGILNFALFRSQNVHWQSLDVTRKTRAQLKGQKPVLLWFTGLSGSGKSTIANIIDKQLSAMGRHTFTLDGDNVRLGLNKDLGFTDVDRVENIRRIGEVAKLMSDAGLITLVSFISPFRTERQLARNMVGEGEFLEIHVSTPLEVAEARDIKGLYKKARAGELKNFTGIDSPYEVPETPEIVVDTSEMSAEKCANIIIEEMKRRAII